jgi:acyl-CoA dehydrogenase
MRWI